MQSTLNIFAEAIKILFAMLAVFGRVSSMQLMARRRRRRKTKTLKSHGKGE
ncbi:MAG TPA: hypothetical protein VMU35_09685 [Methylomirabilota bacterium]|nr:hypothetical protein [Methylomirabilota bacterium]